MNDFSTKVKDQKNQKRKCNSLIAQRVI